MERMRIMKQQQGDESVSGYVDNLGQKKEKTCRICKKTKPLIQFDKKPHTTDGFQASCRSCNKLKGNGTKKTTKKRFPECTNYDNCLNEYGYGLEEFECRGCEQYQEGKLKVSLSDLPGCLDLLRCAFYPRKKKPGRKKR